MHRTVIVSCCVLVLLAPRHGAAQTLQSFEVLALRVNLDDQVRIEDQSGVKASGRVTRLTRDQITIQTTTGEKRFTSDTVRAVAVRDHALRRGALIGAGAFAVLNAVVAAKHGNAGGAAGALGAAVAGAGVGAAMGAFIPQMRTAYRASESRVPVPRSPGLIGVQPSLLEDLALHVNLDDQLRIEDQSGIRTNGRLTRLTDDDITIQTDNDEKHFTRATVRQVAVRRQSTRMGALIGAAAGAVLGAWTACRGGENADCPDGVILLGGLGAGVGVGAGALIKRTTIVYPEPEKRALVLPVISRSAAGIRVSLHW